MSASSNKAIPSWLSRANDKSHLESVISTLADREAKREIARSDSSNTVEHSKNAKKPAHSFRSLTLSRLLERNKPSGHYSVAIAHRADNQRKNRYYDIEPYDRTRVVVDVNEGEKSKGDGNGKYLNASWVLERFGHKWWIATQAPLPNTAHTFLSLFLQPITCPPQPLLGTSSAQPRVTQVRTIVQLTQNFESGRRKANPYFSNKTGKSKLIVPDDRRPKTALKTTLLQSRTIKEAHCVQSTVSLVPITLTAATKRRSHDSQSSDTGYGDDESKWGEESGKIVVFQHMLYTAWPDHGVPDEDDEHSLLPFIQLVDRTNRDLSLTSRQDNLEPDPDPPIIVGCSAGVGRTGSFIALSSLLRMYEHLPPAGSPTLAADLPASPLGPLPQSLREDLVALEVDSLREQRPGMVQRDEQLLLVYEMLMAALGS
jgi:protein tyrosine phosphatase